MRLLRDRFERLAVLAHTQRGLAGGRLVGKSEIPQVEPDPIEAMDIDQGPDGGWIRDSAAPGLVETFETEQLHDPLPARLPQSHPRKRLGAVPAGTFDLRQAWFLSPCHVRFRGGALRDGRSAGEGLGELLEGPGADGLRPNAVGYFPAARRKRGQRFFSLFVVGLSDRRPLDVIHPAIDGQPAAIEPSLHLLGRDQVASVSKLLRRLFEVFL